MSEESPIPVFDEHDVGLWRRRWDALTRCLFQWRHDYDDLSTRLQRIEQARSEDMRIIAELRETVRLIEADYKEHQVVHGKLNAHLKKRFDQLRDGHEEKATAE